MSRNAPPGERCVTSRKTAAKETTFIVELIIVRIGVLLIETLGSFGVALNLFSADLGPSCHDFYFFIIRSWI